jgi:hypothetical protein
MVILAVVYSLIALLAVGCAKETPTSIPETYNVAPAIQPTAPALAWYDLSDSLLTVHVDKLVYGEVLIDTCSLWITAFNALPYDTRYAGYKSTDWTWAIDDTGSTYALADSLLLEITWWVNGGAKQTATMTAVLRTGGK